MTVHEDSADTNALILGLGNQIVSVQLHAQAALTQQPEFTEEDAERAAEPVGTLWSYTKNLSSRPYWLSKHYSRRPARTLVTAGLHTQVGKL